MDVFDSRKPLIPPLRDVRFGEMGMELNSVPFKKKVESVATASSKSKKRPRATLFVIRLINIT
jgi:hypothetical protein